MESLTESEFKDLQKLFNRFMKEADKCASVQAYFAACAVLGAALEAALLAMVDVFPEEAECAMRDLRIKSEDPKDWSLDILLRVSFSAGWIPSKNTDNPEQGELGDWLLNFVKELRNLIHPGKKIRDYRDLHLTQDHFKTARDLVECAIDQISSKITKSLSKALIEEKSV